jgi:dTDP-4-amino-4,6-dideoxygalactose transaminase
MAEPHGAGTVRAERAGSDRMIHISRAVVGPAELEAMGRVMRQDGYLGMGREVRAFEEELETYLGGQDRRVICLNSGTAALHLAVQAVTRPGDEVLVQSLTFVATFQAISAAQAVPVACEVAPETLTLDLKDAAQRVTPRTRAVMPVHYASNPGDLEAIYEFARGYGLRVIEDAAHAFGCTYQGRKIGSGGDIVCFSFDGIKNITSGEGGAVVTSDPEVIQSVQDARLLGVQRDTEKRYQGERSWEFDVRQQGYRYHLSNLFAALGRVQLRRFEAEFKPRRIELAQKYRAALLGQKDLRLLHGDPGPIVPHIFPIRVLNGKRDGLRQFLSDRGIESGIHYKPNHLLSYFGGGKGSLPVTEKLYEELLTLPLHSGLTDADLDQVIVSVQEFLSDS